jgi:hypothetical protein
MDRIKRFWAAFKDIAIIFSFVVNLVLVLVLLILVTVLAAPIKSAIVGPLVVNLDTAFMHLGEAHIRDTISINQKVPVQFTVPLKTQTVVVLTQPVPLRAPAKFSLGAFGEINGTVSLNLPTGMALPVMLDLQVPIDHQLPVTFDQPIDIDLGKKGLGPVVDELRGILKPYIELINSLPF